MRFFSSTKNKIPTKKTTQVIRQRPFFSFFTALGVLLIVIILGNVISTLGREEVSDEQIVRDVEVYGIGTSPKVTTQATIEKTGIITVVAQTAGIVQNVYVKEGDNVVRGTSIVSLSSNYQGGSAPGIQAAIANTQYRNTKNTFDTQKEIIEKQREIASNTENNTNELREISEDSLGETRDLIDLNDQILDSINNNITTLENTNVGGSNDQMILQAKQLKAQAQVGVNQLRTSLRNTEYQTDTDKPPTKLAQLQKDVALKQLDVQEQALGLSLEVAALQSQLAGVNASLMTPSSPSNGTVQRIHVRFGQAVSPGDIIATIFQPDHDNNAVARIPGEVAKSISKLDQSRVVFADGTETLLSPIFVSSEATNGQLFSVIFAIPNEYTDKLTDKESITIEIPIGTADTTSTIPYVPVDAVYQTDAESTIFVAEGGKATAKKVQLGKIFGSFIEIKKGLTRGDQVILTRSVVANDPVNIVN